MEGSGQIATDTDLEPAEVKSGTSTLEINDYDDVNDHDDDDDDDDSFTEETRPKERWAPLGAVASPESDSSITSDHESGQRLTIGSPSMELRHLEEEQEQLNSCLLSLTTHFTQVQFRLRQIVSGDCSSPTERERLLRELEEFASRGVPDVRAFNSRLVGEDKGALAVDCELEAKVSEQRLKQVQLIEHLKSQLDDMESYAYEAGDLDQPPTSQLIEKQRVIIDELRAKLGLDLEDMDRLSTDELRKVVDVAICQIINPVKVKEKLVEQLKTQVTDLERFIHFLQEDSNATSTELVGVDSKEESHPITLHGESYLLSKHSAEKQPPKKVTIIREDKAVSRTSESSPASSLITLVKNTLAFLHVMVANQLRGDEETDRAAHFHPNRLKSKLFFMGSAGQHWGDLRARLEVAVVRVIERVGERTGGRDAGDMEYDSDTEQNGRVGASEAIVRCVRKELCPILAALLEHGLVSWSGPLVRPKFNCLCGARAYEKAVPVVPTRAWHLFLAFYDMKHGHEYNESTARKLSDTFKLDMVGGKAVTVKQQLLTAIHTVLETHQGYNRSDESQFKALVCIALNQNRLSKWLRLLVKNPYIVDRYYSSWSYTVKTGFDDALHCINRLTSTKFNLPYDLVVQQFANLNEAF